MPDTAQPKERELDDLFERYRNAPDSYVFVVLADACRKMGRVVEALEICHQGVERHPNYASGHVVMGKCLFDSHDHDYARVAFERVLELDENNLVALKYLGMIEAEAGHFDTAKEHLEHILALDPDNKSIRETLREVQEQQSIGDGDDDNERAEHDDAVKPIDVGDGLETSDELATITLAEIFASQGYAEKARTIYNELLRRNPNNDVVRVKLEALDGGHLAEDVDPGYEVDEVLESDTVDLAGDDADDGDDARKDETSFAGVNPEHSVDHGEVTVGDDDDDDSRVSEHDDVALEPDMSFAEINPEPSSEEEEEEYEVNFVTVSSDERKGVEHVASAAPDPAVEAELDESEPEFADLSKRPAVDVEHTIIELPMDTDDEGEEPGQVADEATPAAKAKADSKADEATPAAKAKADSKADEAAPAANAKADSKADVAAPAANAKADGKADVDELTPEEAFEELVEKDAEVSTVGARKERASKPAKSAKSRKSRAVDPTEDNRPPINEKDNVTHFRRWLGHIKD